MNVVVGWAAGRGVPVYVRGVPSVLGWCWCPGRGTPATSQGDKEMKSQVRSKVQTETAERRAAVQRRVSQQHMDLLAAIDECLADPDPSVQRAARRVAQECLADSRGSRMHHLAIGDKDTAAVRQVEISDLHGRARS